ncbi:MAG: FtsQ-type POTRA domain-containing protein [Anaerolineae bacterium]|nr:FtsQ-type POTRA domain-containing protein [Anaerolineae bacterium]MCO5192922.1 FtsQ-type POTRA domain-containing protein [Anaerolineae bacterium]MCO5198446.1 FtsQ-type POTRA domain-containing protein [Anaerolineae bacterium]
MNELRQERKRRLRKQPRRRMQAATSVPLPKVAPVPKTVRKRRLRKSTEPLRQAGSSLRTILFSTRWYSVALLALCIYALYLIGDNPRYYLTNISVQGATALSAEDVTAISALGGQHIFAVRPDEAAAKIGQLPGVVMARVETHWPDETHIVVEEDTPVIAWTENGNTYWVNNRGEYIPAATIGTPPINIVAELPPVAVVDDVETAVTDTDAVEEESAESVSVPIATFLRFVAPELMVGAQQLHDLRPDIEQFNYSLTGGLGFQDERGWYVYFGSGADMAQKDALHEAIVADLRNKSITPTYISVSDLAKPYYFAPGLAAIETGEG